MTEFLTIGNGQIAYDVTGDGPLIVLSHGMGDHRNAFRHLAPLLVDAGYRVANADMRGHGESSMNWTSHDGSEAISRTDVAGDLLALIRHLSGPAVIIGHSLSGGAATIAAAQEPELVSAVIELGPFTKNQTVAMGALFTVGRYRRGALRLIGTQAFKSLGAWMSYLDVAYPTKPADHAEAMAALAAKLREPGRFADFLKTGKSTPADAHTQLPNISCPALIVMGTEDPDWADPKAEADAVVALMPAGLGRVELIPGSGHYPHADAADRVAELTVKFLAGQQHA
ncbi:alpha/beta fold hydrolase [Nocardia macrotermitis]|uniref:2-(Acetamidomethylene)succinate hydrolase n=1 Tax=Nocardia macrotermitis TaxID=2585198 RepID=A0A7K0DCH1_9NOCA|nr:alpha/beta hydrolase [Nocardia macrotermitis]MQY23473.1 2-(acetamidomethylene)succinate hydrolase [Nocardia macrotermitis]